MPEAAPSLPILCFGAFELDLRAGELRKQGLKIKLQERPLQILALLLGQPGQVVTREEIRRQLWAADTFVDFDHSVNSAVNKLREALGDSAENPRFIETLRCHGYRFIAPVEPGVPAYDRRALGKPALQECKGPAPGDMGMKIVPDRPPAGSAPAAAVRPPTTVHDRREKRHRLAAIAVAAVAAMVVFGTLLALDVGGLRERLFGPVARPKIESIAVLPLENLSGDPAQEYFADGMTDALITDLGKISGIRVISRTSVMHYKNTHRPLSEIARELHVDAVLEGAVLRSGDKVRITAQLVRVSPERQVWAETYDRDLRDVLSLQSDVALAIAGHVRAELTPRERTQVAIQHPVDPRAYTAYLKGRYERHKENEEGYKKSVEYFRQAINLDPDYGLAYAGLAGTYAAIGNNELLSPHEAYPLAEAAALRALEIDGKLADAHAVLGLIEFRYDWNWLRADSEYRQATKLSPSIAGFHQSYGWYLTLMGRWAQAREEIQQAQMLDPFSPYNHASMGDLFYCTHKFGRAVAQLQETVRIFGGENNSYAHSLLAKVYAARRVFGPAIAEQKQAITIFGDCPLYLAILGNTYGLAGEKPQALEILNQLKEQSKRKYVSPYDIALVYIGLGNKDEALAWLEKAYQAHSSNMSNLEADPTFDSLRSDPRFQDLLHRMNFPP